jgi:transposase
MAGTIDRKEQQLSTLAEENKSLRVENNILKTDIGYWKARHQQSLKREESYKKELQDKNARIKYLTRQLYEKKTEQAKKKPETTGEPALGHKRKRGQQPGRPQHDRRDQSHLPEHEEVYDLGEHEKYCSQCGLPLTALPSTEDSEILETQEVSGYRRTIRRKKYIHSCSCPREKGVVTAAGPAKLIPKSRYGTSIWIHILLRKYHLQIPVARILKNLSLHGLSIPPGSVGDGLKRLAPLFEPVYAALEERSRNAAWWQADETRWCVFETTKTKTNFRWYLWVFISDESIVHVIDPTRSAQVIQEHLGEICNGILLVDRYSAYKSYASKREGVTLAFCWAHARRDFREAGLQYEEIREWAGSWEARINEVFHLNTLRLQYTVGSTQYRRADTTLRQAIAAMEIDLQNERKKIRLHHRQNHVLKSMAVHWEGLTVFLDHPEIPMDNNGSERALRTPVVGRKNYYGSGAIWSARFTAVMFSLFETLQQWDINPVEWLSDYFRSCALAGGIPPEDVSAHLPWNITERRGKTWKYSGRVFTEPDIQCIVNIIGQDTSRSRTMIARLACEHLQWYKPDKTPKTQSMSAVLGKMEADGLLTLPPSRHGRSVHIKPIQHTKRTNPGEELLVPAGKLGNLRITIARGQDDQALWNEYVDRYHYLGYTPLAGAQMKYFVYAGEHLVALVGFGASAWKIAPRDWLIGWSSDQREANLHLIVNNSRFLILPWVCSKNLASKVLASVSNRLAGDWQERYSYKPVLLETFVEKNRFAGTCYKAANWQHVGTTQGRGRKDRFSQAALPVKDIFLFPLQKDFKTLLC